MNQKELIYAKLFSIISFGLSYKKEDIFKNAKGIRIIQYGNYVYKHFNVCFLHDMLSQILMTMYEGYIPIICQPFSDHPEWTDWGHFFYQPFSEFDLDNAMNTLPITYADKRVETYWGPEYHSIYSDWEATLAFKLYRDFVTPNEETSNYINNEFSNLLKGKNVLGVLSRGTDFVGGKPKGHPIQPDFNQLLSDTEDLLKRSQCDYIYLATEEKAMEDSFKDAFPGIIITNKRHYFDKDYYKHIEKKEYIGISGLVLDNVSEIFEEGLEYLSSIYLLSKCKSLIGGNCGGSNAAIYLNDGKYEERIIYNLGLY